VIPQKEILTFIAVFPSFYRVLYNEPDGGPRGPKL